MKIGKRIFLFLAVNILVVTTISIVLNLLGVKPYLSANGINYQMLMIFCLVWGFGGAFISLALSKVIAKWSMGVQIIGDDERRAELRGLRDRVHELARRAGISKMPEVGIYESPDLNAFATGPSKNNSLVAVSTGLLANMTPQEVDGVLAHEVAHVANGDMVTMTLVQGVVNAFVMFLARVAGFFISQAVDEEKRPWFQFAVVLVLEILLGILGMMVVAAFSRRREFRADAGAASLSSRGNMIAALERLKLNYQIPDQRDTSAIASLQISSNKKGLMRFFSTHPDLDDRIAMLRKGSF